MKFVIFCQSVLSDWTNESAHYLRGLAVELDARGYDVAIYEPADSDIVTAMREDAGQQPFEEFFKAFPSIRPVNYDPQKLNLDQVLKGVNVVLVTDWNDPALISAIGQHHVGRTSWRLLFYDALQRPSPELPDLTGYDGVLAIGKALRDVYAAHGWSGRVWTWNQAADIGSFHPVGRKNAGDLVWIGNWVDGRHPVELQEFLFEPVRELGLKATVYGVGYPDEALRMMADAGIDYGGYLPGWRYARAFAAHSMTVHIPNRVFGKRVPGVPSNRMFEALACGVPVISSPWNDAEGLFGSGDYLRARSGEEMAAQMDWVLMNEAGAREMAENGRRTVMMRHTCGHRVDELLQILESMEGPLPSRIEASSG